MNINIVIDKRKKQHLRLGLPIFLLFIFDLLWRCSYQSGNDEIIADMKFAPQQIES